MRFVPDIIEILQPNEVFVYSSNANYLHCNGAACTADERFGVVWGRVSVFEDETMNFNDAGRFELFATLC